MLRHFVAFVAAGQLWNAFHNCSVAPKTPRFTRSGSTTTGTLRFFGTTFKNFKAEDRMKTIALIDTRSEVPGKTLGILVSTHPDMVAAFAGNDAFQKAEGGGRHIRTKILTLKDPLDPGQPVRPTHLAESQMNQTKFE